MGQISVGGVRGTKPALLFLRANNSRCPYPLSRCNEPKKLQGRYEISKGFPKRSRCSYRQRRCTNSALLNLGGQMATRTGKQDSFFTLNCAGRDFIEFSLSSQGGGADFAMADDQRLRICGHNDFPGANVCIWRLRSQSVNATTVEIFAEDRNGNRLGTYSRVLPRGATASFGIALIFVTAVGYTLVADHFAGTGALTVCKCASQFRSRRASVCRCRSVMAIGPSCCANRKRTFTENSGSPLTSPRSSKA